MADQIEILPEGSNKQVKYYSASDSCFSLGTLVPKSMAMEQKRFNQRMKTDVGDVDEYVAEKLHYKSVSDLCGTSDKPKFSREQIDAIATAIYNHEKTGNAIIVADQTGVGKGRIASGLIRYAILEKKVVPFFITEKKHLLHDIYRDLVDIGFDAGVPMEIIETDEKDKKVYTDSEILELIKEDIENEELRIFYDFDEYGEDFVLSNLLDENYIEVLNEIIEQYRNYLETDGVKKYVKNSNRKSQLDAALSKGLYEVKPFTTFPMDIKDKEGNILYKNEDKDIKAIFKKASLPSDYKLIAFPYSQVARPYGKTGELTDKSKFIQKMAKNTIVIMDESHSAAGFDTKGKLTNTAKMVQTILGSAQMVTFLSATFAKRPENMFLYAGKNSIGETGLSGFALKRAFEEGDISLQEAVSSELVRTGQLVRREKEIMGETTYYYESDDSEIGVSQVNKLNKVAESFSKVNEFASYVKQALQRLKNNNVASKDYKFAGNVNRFQFQLFNFFVLGLKVEQTTREALTQLNSGRKVVISVANTLESAFKNMKKDFIYDVGFDIGDDMPNDFNLFLAYLLDYTLRIALEKEAVVGGTITKEREILLIKKSTDDVAQKLYDMVEDEYKQVMSEILSVEIRTPISPIDEIKKKIEMNNFSVDEITGRTLFLDFQNQDFSKGVLSRRKPKKKEEIIRDFNENKVDCVILNQAGAVGVSMHPIKVGNVDVVLPEPPTSLKNKKEVKQRCMIITQMELDINKEVQKLGRINRTGQVYPPIYRYIISAIPSESRLTALNQKKLSSLSANVSSNQSQSEDLFSTDDFYSSTAVEPFNQTMVDLNRNETANSKRDIEEFTKNLYFTSYDFQNNFYKTFSDRLNKHIKFLKDNNLYQGSVSIKDYKAKDQQIHPFIIGNNDSLSSFGRHSVLEISNCTEYATKYLEYDVTSAIKGRFSSSSADSEKKEFNTLDKFVEYYDKFFEGKLKEKKESINKIIEQNNIAILGFQEKIKDLKNQKKKEGVLKEAIDLDDKINSLNKEIATKTGMVSTLLLEQKLDEMNATLKEVQDLQKEVAVAKQKLESNPEYVDLLSKRDDFNKINSEIENAESQIDKIKKNNDSYKSDLKEYENNVKLAESYYTNIGKILDITLLSEDDVYDYDSEGQYTKIGYNYTKVFENKSFVLTGFAFTGSNYDNLNLGNMSIYLMGVTERETLELSRIHKTFTEKDRELKRQNLVEIKNTEVNYLYKKDGDEIGAWNKIASLLDTGYEVEKYILTGSLLKCFSTLQGIGISGSIVKYSTADGKNRIGVELNDKSKKAFQDRLSTTNYMVYFDVISSNYRKLVVDYFEKNRNFLKGIWNEVFQLGFKDKIFLQTFYSGSQMGSANSDDFVNDLKVRIYSEKASFCEYMLTIFAAVGIEDYLMLSSSSSSAQSNVNGRYYSDYSDFVIWKVESYYTGELFENIFPASETTYTALNYYNRINLGFALEISVADFFTILEYLKNIKNTFTSATSNGVIEKNKDFYIFEQNVDEIQGFEATSSNDYIPQDMLSDEVEMELDEIIDSLLEHLR